MDRKNDSENQNSENTTITEITDNGTKNDDENDKTKAEEIENSNPVNIPEDLEDDDIISDDEDVEEDDLIIESNSPPPQPSSSSLHSNAENPSSQNTGTVQKEQNVKADDIHPQILS